MIFAFMGRRTFYTLLTLGSLLLSIACETPVATRELPSLTFVHLRPFKLDVASIEIVNQFKSPMTPPNIEHRLPTPPATALIRWARDRLKAVGDSNKLKIFIEEASATETPLNLDKSLKGHLTKQQSHAYSISLRATLLLTNAHGVGLASAKATATRSTTIREDLSINERERVWFNLIDRLMSDFNQQIEVSLQQHLGNWLH
tara:strand:- start:524 stop:1129 length:606 start_codon:yes stop_codon:yes gene_type:complete